MTVYIDVYFLLNFCMDLFALLICRRILGYRAKLYRSLLAALAGAFYAVLTLPLTHALFTLLHLLFGALMALIACGYGSLRRFVRLLLFFYGVCFFLGGAVTALSRGYAALRSGSSGVHVTAAVVLFTALLGGALCLLFGKNALLQPGKRAVTVTVTRADTRLCFQGYADSGNVLRDPVENTPVILANAALSRKIFTMLSQKPPPEPRFALEPCHYEGLPFRLIPCDTVGGRVILPALKLQTVQIENEPCTVCIALDFARSTDYCGYEALIPSTLL